MPLDDERRFLLEIAGPLEEVARGLADVRIQVADRRRELNGNVEGAACAAPSRPSEAPDERHLRTAAQDRTRVARRPDSLVVTGELLREALGDLGMRETWSALVLLKGEGGEYLLRPGELVDDAALARAIGRGAGRA